MLIGHWAIADHGIRQFLVTSCLRSTTGEFNIVTLEDHMKKLKKVLSWKHQSL